MATPDLTPGIQESAANPAGVAVDGLSVTAQPISAQIQADRYLNAKNARGQKRRGLMFQKLIPAAAIADGQGTQAGTGSGSFDSPGY